MSVGAKKIRNVESREWNWLRRYADEQGTVMGRLLTRWLAEKRREIEAKEKQP